MEILELEQNTEQWLEARLNYCCASEAPVIMGASKHMSRDQLLRIKKGWQQNPISEFKKQLFQSGHDHEAASREIEEMETLEELKPCVGKKIVHDIAFLASFDGLQSSGEPWEHKDQNAVLAENVRNNTLEAHHYWQLEHQILVAGGDKCKFVCSDGTLENRVSMIYQSTPERRKELIAGWKQFLRDLEAYEIEPIQELITAKDVNGLPALSYQIDGSIITSNIDDVIEKIADRAAIEMSKELQCDQDLEDQAKLNKLVKAARKKLSDQNSEILSNYKSYADFTEQVKKLDSILQKMQSVGEKKVKTEKDRMKNEAIDKASNLLSSEIKTKESWLGYQLPLIDVDFKAAIKGKSKISSCNDAIDNELAKARVLLNKNHELFKENLKQFDSIAREYKHIFHDLQSILNIETDAFIAIVKNRIAEHVAAEKERIENEKIKKQQIENERLEKEEIARTQGAPKEILPTKVEINKTSYDQSAKKEDGNFVTLGDKILVWAKLHSVREQARHDLYMILRENGVNL